MNNEKSTLKFVEQYLECRLYPFPLKPGKKLGVRPDYHPYQLSKDDFAVSEFKKILSDEPGAGIGLIMSRDFTDENGLNHFVAIDFDTDAAYRNWAKLNKDFAKIVPTAKTHKGYHVLFRNTFGINAGVGGPVSIIADGWHIAVEPSLHPCGSQYRWLKPPMNGIPLADFWDIVDGLDLNNIDFGVDDYCAGCGSPDCECIQHQCYCGLLPGDCVCPGVYNHQA